MFCLMLGPSPTPAPPAFRHDPDQHLAPDAVESVQKDHKKGWDDDWWRHSKRYMAKRNLQFKMVQCLEVRALHPVPLHSC